MSHIFISHSSQGIDFVRYLRTLLESEGFAVRGQPVFTYKRIKDVEVNLARALSELKLEALL